MSDQEHLEGLVPRGARGEPGEQGRQGERGDSLSRPVRRALVFLFALNLIFAVVNLIWTGHEVHASRSAIQSGQAHEQTEQRKQGQLLEQKLCSAFGGIAALKPPPGNPKTNPSRAYDQNLHAKLDELGTDLGCTSQAAAP